MLKKRTMTLFVNSVIAVTADVLEQVMLHNKANYDRGKILILGKRIMSWMTLAAAEAELVK